MGNKKTFVELIGKKDFVKKIVELQDEREVIKAFENEGVTPTNEEMESLKKILNRTCDEFAKHSKEEIKEIKEMFDNLTEQQLVAVAGGGKDKKKKKKNNADEESPVWDFLGGVFRRGADAAQTVIDSKTRKYERDIKISDNDTDRFRKQVGLAESNNRTKVWLAGMGIGAALSTLYMFKDDIKGWFRK